MQHICILHYIQIIKYSILTYTGLQVNKVIAV